MDDFYTWICTASLHSSDKWGPLSPSIFHLAVPPAISPSPFPVSASRMCQEGKSKYANAKVSGGAGVSQQGQKQVSMAASTYRACKSKCCTTRPPERSLHTCPITEWLNTQLLAWCECKGPPLSLSQARSSHKNSTQPMGDYINSSVWILVSKTSNPNSYVLK